jgi:hypothetical protein
VAIGGVVLALLALQGGSDTLTFATPATRALVERAAARHRVQESEVTDYRARLRFRTSFSLGRRLWARLPVAAAEELDATVHWGAPNDLRVDMHGRRGATRIQDADIRTVFSRPWFFPRGVGDSVRLFGNDFPERAALHPLAAGGPAWYRYAIVDSQRVVRPDGEPIRLYTVEVMPRSSGEALVAGYLMLDAGSAEVVRFTFRFVGTGLWDVPTEGTPEDSASSRRANRLVSRILQLDADLEYALQDGRYWMPYRQVISGRVQVPFIGDIVVPFEMRTHFDDYEVNTGQPVAFSVPIPPEGMTREERRAWRDSVREDMREAREDSTTPRDMAGRWQGGSYQVHYAPADSMRAWGEWSDSLVLDPAGAGEEELRDVFADLARLSEDLPGDMVGRPTWAWGYERLADAFRYNRVQGVALGAGMVFRPDGVPFVRLQGTARYGLADGRLNLRGGVIRESPSGRWTLAGYHEVAAVDGGAPVGPLANSVNALFTGHDDAEYYRATGASLDHERSVGQDTELLLGVTVERQGSVRTEAESFFNDITGGNGLFPPNPPVAEGWAGGARSRLSGRAGSATWRLQADGLAVEGSDASAAALVAGRLHGLWRQPIGGARGLTLEGAGGATLGDSIPQALFRVGGTQSVRGQDYGVARGEAFWTVRADWNPFQGRGPIRPVIFADAGQAAALDDLDGEPVYAGAGIGFSLFRGLARLDLSVPFAPEVGSLRVDFSFGAPR